jgi:tungstate transport system substrate-binding protein
MNSVSGRQHRLTRALGALLALAVLSLSWAAEGFIVLQSTTSTQNSGLLEHVLPLFTKQT